VDDEATRTPPELEALDPLTLAVNRVVGASRDLTVRMARVMRTNVTDMTAILVLSEHGPLGATELADRLGIRLASTTVLVDRLERAGHVERVRDPGDRRRVRVSATTTARTASWSAWRPAIEEIDDVCRALPADQRAFVSDLLDRLATAMDRGGLG
jgi:DNA-binding MarR family transcriptional regulator